MNIDLVSEAGTKEWTGPLDEFVQDNELDGAEQRRLMVALKSGFEYHIGGGAMPVSVVRKAVRHD